MAAKFTRLTHKIAIQLHLVAESCNICSSHSRWTVRKLLYTTSYIYTNTHTHSHHLGKLMLLLYAPGAAQCTGRFISCFSVSNYHQWTERWNCQAKSQDEGRSASFWRFFKWQRRDAEATKRQNCLDIQAAD